MKKLFALLTLLAAPAFAAIPVNDAEFAFNRLPGTPPAQKYLMGTMIREAYNTAVCIHDFSIQGGAVAAVNLEQNVGAGGSSKIIPCSLPKGAIVRGGFIDVVTAYTGASATVSLGMNSGVDLLGATAVASLGVGRTALVPVFATPSSYIKAAAAVILKATVGTAVLTAGRMRIFIDYVQSE